MSEEITGGRRSAIDRFRQTDSIKVAIIAVVVAWLGKGGVDKLIDRVFPDDAAVLARLETKVDALKATMDKFWQIRGPREQVAKTEN